MVDTNLKILNADGSAVYIKELKSGGVSDPNIPVISIDQSDPGVTNVVSLAAGTNAIGKLSANSGIDIGDVDVLSLPALAAGTNAIGKLAANSGIDIGDVDVLSLPSLPAGTNAIGKLAANSGIDIGDVDVLSLPALPTGTNNIGDVDVLSLPSLVAGTAVIGKVGIDQTTEGVTNRVVTGGGISIKQTPSLSVSAYSAYDANGGMLTFANAARVSGGSGILSNVFILDKTPGNTLGFLLYLFDRTFTAVADHAGVDFTDADMDNCVGMIVLPGGNTFPLASNSSATTYGLNIQYTCQATSLYGQLFSMTSRTSGANDLSIKLFLKYLD